MPILSAGSYTAHVSGGDGDLLTVDAASFTYLPVNRVLILCFAFYFFRRFRGGFRDSGWSAASRIVVLLPGAVGVVPMFFVGQGLESFAVPLLTVTLTFILWDAWKARECFPAVCVAFVASGIVMFLHMLLQAASGVVGIAFVSVLAGAVNAYPIVVLRVAIRHGVTWPRLCAGVALATLPPFFVAALFLGMVGLIEASFAVPLYFCISALPFCALVRWNPWARSIATGELASGEDCSEEVHPTRPA
jgi:hypothetical protein